MNYNGKLLEKRNDNLLAMSSADNIINKEEDVHTDTQTIGILDAIDYLGVTTQKISDLYAAYGEVGFTLLALLSYKSTPPGYLKFANGFIFIFGKTGAAQVDGVNKITYPVELVAEPLIVNVSCDIASKDYADLKCYSTYEDDNGNTYDRKKELWTTKRKISDNTPVDLGNLNYFVLGLWK